MVGIDVSPHMLARAHQRISSNGFLNSTLSLMDAPVMSFADGSFDKVVAMYVATVVPNPQAMVSEMNRVYDGVTIKAENGGIEFKVRLVGIDAPKTAGRRGEMGDRIIYYSIFVN